MIRPLALSILLATPVHAEMFAVTSYQDIYTVNTATGKLKFVGALEPSRPFSNQNAVISLTVNPVDGMLAAVDRQSGNLLELNRRDASVISQKKLRTPVRTSVAALAYNSRGILYGFDGISDELGIYGIIGNGIRDIGKLKHDQIGGFAFDVDNNLRSLVKISQLTYLSTIDTKTAQASLFKVLSLGGSFLGLAFDDRGVAYTTQPVDGNSSDLYEIDPETGDVEFVAEVTGFRIEGDRVVRLAFGRRTACHVALERSNKLLRNAYEFIMNWLMNSN